MEHTQDWEYCLFLPARIKKLIIFKSLNRISKGSCLNSGERGEDRMVRWPHQLDGHEFEQTPRESEGQGSLKCCSPWGPKESDNS